MSKMIDVLVTLDGPRLALVVALASVLVCGFALYVVSVAIKRGRR